MMQSKIQACLDATRDQEPNGWLQVGNWFQEAMLGGIKTSRATLDALHTQRPILVVSSFHHSALVNSRGLALAHIMAATPNPQGGVIEHDAAGQPTGILQDAAIDKVFAVIPEPTAAPEHRRCGGGAGYTARTRRHDHTGRGRGRPHHGGLRWCAEGREIDGAGALRRAYPAAGRQRSARRRCPCARAAEELRRRSDRSEA